MIQTRVMVGFFTSLLALTLFSAAAEECGVFCTIGKWWGSLTGGGKAAGKAASSEYTFEQLRLAETYLLRGYDKEKAEDIYL